MKNLIFTFTLLILGTFSLMAQITPQSFKYQGVARDNGMVVTGGISLQISIRSGSTNGAIVYQERQFPTTNDYGVFSVEVGGISAIVTQGDFEAIDWSTGEYFMQVGLDPSGGASFTDLGTTQLASVPFALFAETARTALDDNDTDPSNEIQGLSLNGTILEIDNGNMVDLAPIISQGDDDQNLILSGTNLSIENGNSIDLSVIQDGVTDADSDPSNEIQDLTLTLTGTVLSIEDGNAIDLGPVIPPGGTDDQNLSISGNTLSIEGGNSVDLSVVQDGTQDADADPNNEIQTLSLSGTSLSIQNGNTVDLSIVQDGVNDADADPSNELQDLTLIGTVIQIENGNSIDLSPVIPPGGTDDQNLMLNGTSLTIEDGNTIDLAPIIPPGGTDDQNLTLNGTTLTIEDGNTIDLAPIIPPGGTDDQNLILNGSNLEIEDGNIVDMSSFLDNTDAQDLSLSGNNLNLTNDGTAVDLSSYLDNTDAQDLSLSGNSLNLTNDGTPVDLSSYLDNTDVQDLANVLGQGNSANSKITNLTNPTNAQDAATKNYVDGQIANVSTDLVIDGDDDTKIQVDENNNDEDKIRFDLEGTEKIVLTRNTNENLLIEIPNNDGHVFIGSGAGAVNTLVPGGAADPNTFIGNNAGNANTNGHSNTFIGDDAGMSNNTGFDNTIVGADAGKSLTTGFDNTILGHNAGADLIGGDFNVFIGESAGQYNINGTGNVFIGNDAGENETGSNILIIENSDSPTPLIYGEFNNDLVRINGRLEATQGLVDADNDTKILLEDDANFDKIRFEVEGTEKLILKRNPAGNLLMDIPNNDGHVFIGSGAGANNSSTDIDPANTFIGNQAGNLNEFGHSNTFIGDEAGKTNSNGNQNTFIGTNTGKANDGGENTFIGFDAGTSNTFGKLNTFVGTSAGHNNDFGDRNTYIGMDAGYNSTGSGNVFLGEKAGFSETGDNKLHIGTGVSSSSLIYGDFFEEILSFNAKVGIGTYTPTATLEVQPAASGGNDGVEIQAANGNRWNMNNHLPAGSDLTFYYNGTERMTIDENGDVGIGTTSANNSSLSIKPISVGSKITLWDGGNQDHHYGFGILGPQLNYHVFDSNASHVFYAGGKNGDGTELMRIRGNGNVGIGTNTPSHNLTVKSQDTETMRLIGPTGTYGHEAHLNFGDGDWVYISEPIDDRMRIQAGGGVGINMNPSGVNTLEVSGNASKATAGDWLANSDARLKKNIQPLSSAAVLEKILSLQGVNYEWNDTKTGYERPQGIQYGFTAQNIQQVFPELVTEDNLGYLQTSYGTYDAMYVEAFRELNNKIERQEEEIEQLHTQLEEMNNLKSRLNRLEAALLSTENTAMTEKEK